MTMITKSNLRNMLLSIGYNSDDKKNIYIKKYPHFDCEIAVNFNGNGTIKYPEDKGLKITHHTTCNFSDNENFVVLECVTRLMDKGYRPEDIELEKEWTLGHDAKGGRADICVYGQDGKMLFIVECKTFGKEYGKEYNNTVNDGGQIFSYWQQERSCQFVAIYASDFDGENIKYEIESINCKDDANIATLAKKDTSIHLYKDAYTSNELFDVWKETYDRRFCGDVIFRDDSTAYQIGVKPLRKSDLKDFSKNDKIVNKFEEILRHNNVSDKENAFNRLIALFICKLVDEIQKSDNDIVDFQYKVGTDTYESLQDRLQRLHKEGMENFMQEKIFYVSDDYAEKLVKQYTGQQRKKMISDLKDTIRILKFYTNNDFAFKDVHNEALFYQNGKVLVEVVQLFEKFRIIGSKDLQMLGDLFEQLLNKGFKQNEGQFFTPLPVTRFIWDSLPLRRVIKSENGFNFPKIIDYSCGAGHFLTEGFEAINANADILSSKIKPPRDWVKEKLYGIEKDYRLARVSKISLFMHGAGEGNIIFGDGLENYPDKNIISNSFDILVANPPYSVKAFKPHLNLKNNDFETLDKISNDGSEIETLFVERISQLVKPKGYAAVILPISILNKENESFVSAREKILKDFYIHAIIQFGSKTFGATGTNTVVLFLEKFDEPPKRIDMVSDSCDAIFSNEHLDGWEDDEILTEYLQKINVSKELYMQFVLKQKDYDKWADDYFAKYLYIFVNSAEVINKKKQKTFLKISEEEQKKWYNCAFYKYVASIEKEKIRYFALVYRQKTLIVTSPDDNREQEQFLGYTWSNRKGQEGIKIKSPGGKLYNPNNRLDSNSIAGLVRVSFDNKELHMPELEKYYYYLNTKDMFDFSSATFNKAIKTNKIRQLKQGDNLNLYKLSDKNIFDLQIGNRVLSSEIMSDGKIPVYSANVFEPFGYIDKQNIADFSVPSVLWGIDGDWMVNLMPINKPFYPTDHCGVLRIKTDKILPEYMVYALKSAGEHEHFSRSNRASTARIKSLSVQIPSVEVQQKIVDEINEINSSIKNAEATLKMYDEKIKSKFVEMFDHTAFDGQAIESIFDLQLGKTPSRNNPDYWNSNDYKWVSVSDMGNYGRYTEKTHEHISQKAALESGIKIVPSNTVIMSFKLTIGRTAITSEDIYTNEAIVAFIQKNDVYIDNDYLRIWLSLHDWTSEQINAVKGATLNKSSIGDTIFPIPPKTLQDEFSDYVKSIDKLKFEVNNEKESLQTRKDGLLIQYFQ